MPGIHLAIAGGFVSGVIYTMVSLELDYRLKGRSHLRDTLLAMVFLAASMLIGSLLWSSL